MKKQENVTHIQETESVQAGPKIESEEKDFKAAVRNCTQEDNGKFACNE